jgi:polyisoprenoid-binding protein YceI
MKNLAATCLVATGLAAIGSAPALAAPYAIDVTHTFVNFEVLHLGISTSRGRFDKSEGTLEFDRAARKGKVDITVDIASVNTGVPALDQQLKSDQFFDAGKFPTARFVADRFDFTGDRLTQVTGAFTMLGKTLPLSLKATRFNCYPHPFVKVEACGGDFEATIQRTLWGMSTFAPDLVGDKVRLVVQIEALKQ